MSSTYKIEESTSGQSINIHDIIAKKRVVAHFQPIVSLTRKKVCGIEGLIRGVDLASDTLISPFILFKEAARQGVTVALDRLCREKVIEAYGEIYKKDHQMLLFLNIDASVLDQVEGSNYLYKQVEHCAIDPRNIVIEVNETRVQDTDALMRFIRKYRALDFLLAVDDCGTGFSNMDRIFFMKPDIIKIDISLIRNIHIDYYKQECFKSLVSLSSKTGALIVAEGIENEQEAITTLNLGAHMLQGYYFARPSGVYAQENDHIKKRIPELSSQLKEHMNRKIDQEKRMNQQLCDIADKVLDDLAQFTMQQSDQVLRRHVLNNKNIECAYMLDQNGKQTSDTISLFDRHHSKKNLLFYSARIGANHCMKAYYYNLMNLPIQRYITEPYISLATGDLCITLSAHYKDKVNNKRILCIDFVVNKIPQTKKVLL